MEEVVKQYVFKLHSSHCAEALSSVALAKKTLNKELVFVVA